MPNHRKPTAQCQVCKAEKPHRELVPAEFVRPAILHLIEKDLPEWQLAGSICVADLNQLELMKELAERKR